MRAIKKTSYINTETGQCFDKQRFVDMQFDDENGYLFWNQKSHVKTFLDSPLPKDFTWAERGRIEELKHYMLQDSQLLVYRSNNCIKPLTVKHFCRILDMSERQCGALIKKMKQAGIIKEVKTNGLTYFAFNPVYGLKAKRISLLMFLWFQEELKKTLPEWAIHKFLEQAKELKPEIEIIK